MSTPAERDTTQRPEATTDEEERIKALWREVRELRNANEIWYLANAFSPKRSSAATSNREAFIDQYLHAYALSRSAR